MKGRQFIRKLRKAGVTIDTKRGKRRPCPAELAGRATVVPVHSDTELAPEFLREICRQLGIDWRKVL